MAVNSVLNLFAGKYPVMGASNIDVRAGMYVDKVVDLRTFPWPWEDATIDGIYLVHVLETCTDMWQLIRECHRILKPGGFLVIMVKHSVEKAQESYAYHSFNYGTMSSLFSSANETQSEPLFSREYETLQWMNEYNEHNPHIKFVDVQKKKKQESTPSLLIHSLFAPMMQPLVNASPSSFENVWGHFVGGADAVVWRGIKR